MNKFFISFLFFLFQIINLKAQMPNKVLVGYWHNWSDINAPYIPLDSIDNRYNVIEIAFAMTTSTTDMTMTFTPDKGTKSQFITQVQGLQNQGKKVLLSIGGANATIDLTTTANKNAFITSVTSLINQYGFDGIDIDIENGSSILITGGTIAAPTNIAQLNLIDAIKQIMANYRATKSKKLLLTITPETAYVQGGQSAFSGIWGGYLPIIHALKDSLDILQVQLYNSGTMYGIDGNIYTQGTADFIIAMTDAAIRGFNTTGGTFSGIPETKIAVGLPACTNAAGGGFVDSASVKAALNYLRGFGTKPGAYTLTSIIGFPGLKGMMTWSINWDAQSNCNGKYQFANNYQGLFGTNTAGLDSKQVSTSSINIYPNPSTSKITIEQPFESAEISITDLLGNQISKTILTQPSTSITIERKGVYFIQIKSADRIELKKVIIN